jgi:N-acetylglucosamine kinase-like BadF-type ATPase
MILLGIDGGGSKTRALVADRELRLLGVGAAGSSNMQVVGLAAATAAIAAAAAEALAAAGRAGAHPAAACLALAGAGRPAERAQLLAWAEAHWRGRPVAVVTDVEPVLAAGTPAGWGVALIAGTGSVCLGRAPDGRLVKVGGWGYLLGDEGSGYDLALRALRLATRTADGRADAHALLAATLAHLGLDAPDALVRRIYGGNTAPAAIAALARPAVALAEAGDPHAQALLAEGARQLALMAATAARRLGLEAAPLALAGGLLGASPALRELVAGQLGAAWTPVTYVEEPASGTLLLARRLLES